MNEIELVSGFDEVVEETNDESQFDVYDSRIQMSVPIVASVQLSNGNEWKSSLLGCLPKNTTLSGTDECIHAVALANKQEESKKMVRIKYANQMYRLLASPESFLPKHLQSDQEKEA